MVRMEFWVKVCLLILSTSMSTKVVNSQHDKRDVSHHGKYPEDLETRVTALEHHLEDQSHDQLHAVVFAAIRGPTSSPPNTGATIVFDQVQLNREGGYDPDTGIFTCPEDGIYFFAFSFLPGQDAGDTTVALVKNDNVHERLYSSLPLGATQLSERSCLLRLEKGDRVWVILEQGSVMMHQASLSFQGYRIST
ncbi:complement C1q tumor necrosis factor-related protein 3-like isoform X2 [Hemitrygon akajei]|uniref:complement C1q tumor necrosis factor-related protein 3-like isoform X2 n=1 Tax=Hemitrygon akajei TaxID=2704970 RepID=UPI003BF9827F